jgi:predicted DNA-binding WGR domain protein
MSTETTTEATEVVIETTEAAKPAAKKATTRKAPVAKPAAKKVATRKSAAKKAETKAPAKEAKKGFDALIPSVSLKASKEKIKESADKAQAIIKNVVYAQLGVYGKVYDEVSSRLESTVEEAPKQWGALVKRGEKVQKDFEKSQSSLKAKIKDGVEKVKEGYKDSLEKVKTFGKKAA